jgi:hypothetical protein
MEAALCAERLRPVVDEVAKAFHDRIMSDSDMDLNLGFGEGVATEKLRQLLFPDRRLAWNGRATIRIIHRNPTCGDGYVNSGCCRREWIATLAHVQLDAGSSPA